METLPIESEQVLRLTTVLGRNGLMLESHQARVLAAYVGLLREWNSKLNLISRKDVEHVWTSHILHSLSLLFYIDFPPGIDLLDLGTGGGLPGIPLAVLRPDLHVTLLDSIRKKTAAVESMVDCLPLGNVTVITSRAEDLLKNERKKFDVIVSRAVAPLSDLLKWTRGLHDKSRRLPVRFKGQVEGLRTPLLVAFKGGKIEDELRLSRSRFPAVTMHEVSLNFEGCTDVGLVEKRLVIADL
jgi:16S rRNA (guanine527-N7)-methyltransferase